MHGFEQMLQAHTILKGGVADVHVCLFPSCVKRQCYVLFPALPPRRCPGGHLSDLCLIVCVLCQRCARLLYRLEYGSTADRFGGLVVQFAHQACPHAPNLTHSKSSKYHVCGKDEVVYIFILETMLPWLMHWQQPAACSWWHLVMKVN
jgi:hypothetical protein